MNHNRTDAQAVPGADIGERVVLTSPAGRSRHAGVLLPPVKAGEPHRVHTDKGKVVRLDGAWLAAPERSPADRRKDRRRQHCDAGRPIYRYDDLPAAQLATKTMLSARRRRPNDGQEPVASYKVHRGYAPLYAVVDSCELPPLPPARRAAWDQARSCACCEATQLRPFPKGPDKRRYCASCQEPAARDWWLAQRTEGRRAATAWAHGVLEAPDAVLLWSPATWPWFALRAENVTGTVLFDGELYIEEVPTPERDWRSPEERAIFDARFTLPSEIVEPLRALEGRRLIAWRDDVGMLRRTIKAAVATELALTVADEDQVGPHYDEWIGERARYGGRSYRYNQFLAHQDPPGGPGGRVAALRAALHAMATGSPPPAEEPGEDA